MGTLHKSAAHIDGRTKPGIQVERIDRRCTASDIDDGVHRADFMEVHLVFRYAVNTALRLGQQSKSIESDFAGPLRQICLQQNAADMGKGTAMLVRSRRMLVRMGRVLVTVWMNMFVGVHLLDGASGRGWLV